MNIKQNMEGPVYCVESPEVASSHQECKVYLISDHDLQTLLTYYTIYIQLYSYISASCSPFVMTSCSHIYKLVEHSCVWRLTQIQIYEEMINIVLFSESAHRKWMVVGNFECFAFRMWLHKYRQANAPVPLCRICSRTRTNGPFKFIRGVIPGHSSPFLSIRIVFFSFV